MTFDPIAKALAAAQAAAVVGGAMADMLKSHGDKIREDYASRVQQATRVAVEIGYASNLPTETRQHQIAKKVAMEMAVMIAHASVKGFEDATADLMKTGEVDPALDDISRQTHSRDTILSFGIDKVLNHLGWAVVRVEKVP